MIVKPKPASTVVLVDPDYNVFLTKRPETMKFLGGFYVFPGGGMEDKDEQVKKQYLLGKPKHPSLATGHYIAAARELFEEVGVLLGHTKEGNAISLSKRKTEFYRKQLIKNQITFSEILETEQIYFNFDLLKYFGHLITPEKYPIRYDTRFFLTVIPEGQSPLPNQHEIAEAFWLAPEEGLRLYKEKKLLMASPTVGALHSIINYKKGQKLYLPPKKEYYL